MQSRRTVKVTLNAQGEPQTTGHVWDGDLQEFHNPMPRWWILLFHLTVLFSVLYLILYPGLGTQWKGVLNWTQVGQYQGEVKDADARFGPIFAAFAKEPVEKVAFDPKAKQIGERLFLNNCAQCHGSDARGSRGFPNLTDPEWMYGGGPDAIKTHDRQRPQRRDAADGGGARRQGRRARRRQLCPVAVRLRARQRAGGARQGEVCSVRGLPRTGSEGQSGARRART